jgi:hypothetical protein
MEQDKKISDEVFDSWFSKVFDLFYLNIPESKERSALGSECLCKALRPALKEGIGVLFELNKLPFLTKGEMIEQIKVDIVELLIDKGKDAVDAEEVAEFITPILVYYYLATLGDPSNKDLILELTEKFPRFSASYNDDPVGFRDARVDCTAEVISWFLYKVKQAKEEVIKEVKRDLTQFQD